VRTVPTARKSNACKHLASHANTWPAWQAMACWCGANPVTWLRPELPCVAPESDLHVTCLNHGSTPIPHDVYGCVPLSGVLRLQPCRLGQTACVQTAGSAATAPRCTTPRPRASSSAARTRCSAPRSCPSPGARSSRFLKSRHPWPVVLPAAWECCGEPPLPARTGCPLPRLCRAHPRSDGTGLRFLEVGAGTGRFATFVRDNYPAAALTVSDLSPFYLQEAREAVSYWQRTRGRGRCESV
jgi:hypothetical protein